MKKIKYLKVIDEELVNEYKTGLNIAKRSHISCTTPDKIPFFINHDSRWIREAEIPKGEEIIYWGNSFWAHKMILGKRHRIKWYFKNFIDAKKIEENDQIYLFILYFGEYFEYWWPAIKDKIIKKHMEALILCCPQHFKIWWPSKKNKISKDKYLSELSNDCCSKYF